jgi:hypothetical protein
MSDVPQRRKLLTPLIEACGSYMHLLNRSPSAELVRDIVVIRLQRHRPTLVRWSLGLQPYKNFYDHQIPAEIANADPYPELLSPGAMSHSPFRPLSTTSRSLKTDTLRTSTSNRFWTHALPTSHDRNWKDSNYEKTDFYTYHNQETTSPGSASPT